MAGGTNLSVRTDREGRVRRLVPSGELDIATVAVLREAFDAVLVEEDAELIILDLAELEFMDSAGLHLLLEMNAACEGSDRLRVVNGSPALERLFDIAGVRTHLPIVGSGDDPLAPID